MITRERFAQGLTLSQYLAQMRMNRDRFDRAFDAAAVRPEDARVLERLGRPTKLLVITEDWCGTSLAYVPAVAKLVASRPEIEMRIFLRDENPDVMDQFLKRGLYRAIPVFAFFDENMNERARFIEQPLA
ncbi:MAG TPA: thioredoxin family protein [Candidatus Methylomirabilis sp.]|nr:thioredoxin family protein [Candidatus Methylomirabilis sp.]